MCAWVSVLTFCQSVLIPAAAAAAAAAAVMGRGQQQWPQTMWQQLVLLEQNAAVMQRFQDQRLMRKHLD
jgi:hypothetical protein